MSEDANGFKKKSTFFFVLRCANTYAGLRRTWLEFLAKVIDLDVHQRSARTLCGVMPKRQLLSCRPWAGVICSLISVLGTCLYFGITCLASRNSGGSFLVFSVGFAVLTLIGTMCAGLLGFLVILSCYIPFVFVLFLSCIS